MIFVACGMIWNEVRLLPRAPRVLPVAAFAGAVVWLVALPNNPSLRCRQLTARTVLGALVVATYTFFIALELSRECATRSLRSRMAAIVVPCLHAAIFLIPLAIRALTPEVIAASWVTIFALETVLYAVGTAFIVLLLVKDHSVGVYRHAASTDFLTGLLNRRAFLENALKLCAQQAEGDKPVTLMMFDLDHFKSINDRFGHAVGDDVLRVFADYDPQKHAHERHPRPPMGGEEFAAIVAEPMNLATPIAERVRASFESAGAVVAGHAVAATRVEHRRRHRHRRRRQYRRADCACRRGDWWQRMPAVAAVHRLGMKRRGLADGRPVGCNIVICIRSAITVSGENFRPSRAGPTPPVVMLLDDVTHLGHGGQHLERGRPAPKPRRHREIPSRCRGGGRDYRPATAGVVGSST